MPQHHSVVQFGFPKPRLLIPGGKDLHSDVLPLPAAPPHLAIPALPCGKQHRGDTGQEDRTGHQLTLCPPLSQPSLGKMPLGNMLGWPESPFGLFCKML